MSWSLGVLKELGAGDEVVGKEDTEWLDAPHLLQYHEMLLSTSPVYICVNDPMQLT